MTAHLRRFGTMLLIKLSVMMLRMTGRRISRQSKTVFVEIGSTLEEAGFDLTMIFLNRSHVIGAK